MASLEDADMSDVKICPSLPIPELINLLRYSIREFEFNEVRKILIDRENSMKSKLENLEKDRDSLKEKVCLLERALSSSALDKFKFEEKWQQTQRECEELKERIKRSSENRTLMSNGESRGDEWCMKACEENSEMARSRMLFILNKENRELKCKHLETVQLLEEYKEKLTGLDKRCMQVSNEMESLRHEKAAADQTVEELRQRELKTNQIIEELRRQNIEAIQTVDELRLKKFESDKAAELNKKMLENLTPRITKVEEAFASMLNVKVEDLANIVKENGNSAGAEAVKLVNLPYSGGKSESLGKDCTLGGEYADNENVMGMSPDFHSTCNSTGIGFSGLLKKGGENSVLFPQTNMDGADVVQNSSGAQHGYHLPRQGESNDTDQEHECKRLQELGKHGGDLVSDDKVPVTKQVISEAGCSDKKLHPPSASGVIVEICDTDDESDTGEGTCNSDIQSDVGVNEMIYAKFVQAPSSQKNKRKKTDWTEGSPTGLSPKRKRSAHGIENKNVPIYGKQEKQTLESTDDKLGSRDDDFSVKPVLELSSPPRHFLQSMRTCDSLAPLQKFDGFTDGALTDSSDESYSDSCMDDLVANLCRQKLSRKWISGADMLKALREDAELCMNAVCALYRRQIFAEKSARDSNMCKGGGFSHIDAMRGRDLAEYLIDGDPELRLRKSVSEVQQQRPDALTQCKGLATIYHERLFEIYCNVEDPFFVQT